MARVNAREYQHGSCLKDGSLQECPVYYGDVLGDKMLSSMWPVSFIFSRAAAAGHFNAKCEIRNSWDLSAQEWSEECAAIIHNSTARKLLSASGSKRSAAQTHVLDNNIHLCSIVKHPGISTYLQPINLRVVLHEYNGGHHHQLDNDYTVFKELTNNGDDFDLCALLRLNWTWFVGCNTFLSVRWWI